MPRIVLDVEGELSAEERDQLRQLFYDALGEFIGVRGGDLDEPHDTLGYVNKRYPDMPMMQRERKIDEVLFRKQLARRLRLAASNVHVDDVSPEMIEAAFVAGDRAAEVDDHISPYPDGSLQHHWWTRGRSYKARLLRAIEAEHAWHA